MITKKRIQVIFLLIITCFKMMGTEIPTSPNPFKYVNDYANLLSPQEENELERKISDFYKQTSNQIAVVTVYTLGDLTPGDYAYKIGNE